MARIKLRRDVSENWELINPVLDLGEPGYETDTNKMKIGNGVDAWTALDFFTGGFNGGTIDNALEILADAEYGAGALILSGQPSSDPNAVGLLEVGGGLNFEDTDIIATFVSNVDSYGQVIVANKNSGTSSSADIVVNNNSVQGALIYGDFGINSTTFVGTGGPFDEPNATYLYASGGELAIGTVDPHNVCIATNDITRIEITNDGEVELQPSARMHILNVTDATSHETGALVIEGGLGVGKTIVADDNLYLGRDAVDVPLTDPVFVAKQPGAGFIQAALVNSLPTGSSDWIAYGSDSTETEGWAAMGFTGPTFADPEYTITENGEGYLFVQGKSTSHGSLVLATGGMGTDKDIVFATGGFLAENEKMRFKNSLGQLHIETDTASTNSTSGALRVDGGAGIGGNLHVGGTINNLTVTQPATAATLTVQNGVTLNFPRSLAFPGTNGTAANVLTTDGSGNLSWGSGLGTTDALVSGAYDLTLTTTGNLELPNAAMISGNTSVTCPAATSTVIYTSAAQYQHTIKLLVEVEGVEGNVAGAEPGDWDTQSCEIMVAKSFRNNTVVASVYGVTYTSLAAIATFTADWNVGLNRVEVKCTPVSTLNNVYVRVSALGLTTSD